MKKNDSPSFLDGRTLMAVALVGLTFVGWQTYMHKKYPDLYNKKVEAVATGDESVKSVDAEKPSDTSLAKVEKQTSNDPSSVQVDSQIGSSSIAEELTEYRSKTLAFEISSKGMGMKGFKLLEYKDHAGKTIEIGHPEDNKLPLETRLMGRPEALDFKIEMVNPNLFVGHAQVGNVRVTKTMEIDPDKYVIDYKVVASGSDDRFIGLTTALIDEVDPVESGNFLMPQFQKQEFFVETVEKKDRVAFDKENMDRSWTGVKLGSVGSHYFTQVVLDNSAIIPEARGRVNHKGKVAELLLLYPILNHNNSFEISYKAFIGPKSFSILQSVNDNMAAVVDLGFFNWIGRKILTLLRAFHDLVGNWGVAVICLTILVRLLVLPLNIYSYKSMKVMQTLQPQIQAMRERLKDDKQKQQIEMMALMKENKANPLAGCLPVLLQFPIFIALYQVLGNSIELYQAPFGLWIHDLSLKDPFYILPVLMGVTMFIQQKITPSPTMDPAQAKMMLMMPIVFTFFMISLPSGLTLYMWVGAVFSVCQQMYFMRQSTPTPAGAK